KGFFYRPTIFADVDPQMRIAQEEIFGPTTALIPVRDVDEAISVSNAIKYGLSSSIFTQDVNAAFRAMRDLEAGITYVNAGRIGDYEHCSWYTEGTGTFLGGEGTSPNVGQAGREERVAELRLETVFPAERQDEVIAALRAAHPYEEPAFDIYELVSGE